MVKSCDYYLRFVEGKRVGCEQIDCLLKVILRYALDASQKKKKICIRCMLLKRLYSQYSSKKLRPILSDDILFVMKHSVFRVIHRKLIRNSQPVRNKKNRQTEIEKTYAKKK